MWFSPPYRWESYGIENLSILPPNHTHSRQKKSGFEAGWSYDSIWILNHCADKKKEKKKEISPRALCPCWLGIPCILWTRGGRLINSWERACQPSQPSLLWWTWATAEEGQGYVSNTNPRKGREAWERAKWWGMGSGAQFQSGVSS